MNIQDFFQTITSQRCPKLQNGDDKTIQEFFDHCILPNMPKKEIIIKWHTLLKQYVNDPDAVFFIRRYASGRDKESNWDIRRGFLTECNNVKYVFVDNFFAQNFFAMAINDFVPTLKDLKAFILDRKIPYGYIAVSKEIPHQAYHRGQVYPLNANGWKLSHVYSANQNDYSFNYTKEVKDLFPKGTYENYTKHSGKDYPSWQRNISLTKDELDKIKAHFLRIIHPINYFLTPKPAYQSATKDIGENKDMIAVMVKYLQKNFGQVFQDYQKMIMAASIPLSSNAGETKINLKYGLSIIKPSTTKKIATTEKKNKSTTKRISSISQNKASSLENFSQHEIACCIRAYLFEAYSFRDLENDILELGYRERGGGFVAQKLMRDLGISNEMKGHFKGHSIAQAIAEADATYLSILQFMKSNL